MNSGVKFRLGIQSRHFMSPRKKYARAAAISAAIFVWLPAFMLFADQPNIALILIAYIGFVSAAAVSAYVAWPKLSRSRLRMAIAGLIVVGICFIICGAMIGWVQGPMVGTLQPHDGWIEWVFNRYHVVAEGIIFITVGGTIFLGGVPWIVGIIVSLFFADNPIRFPRSRKGDD